MYHLQLPSSHFQHHLLAGPPLSQPHCRSSAASTSYPSSTALEGASRWTSRPLTPPSTMDVVAPTLQPRPYQEHGDYYSDDRSTMSRRPYGALSHDPFQGTKRDYAAFSSQSRPVSRPTSPVARQPSVSSMSSHQRKVSTVSSIAPSLQIPRTINSSQGSLAELAAEITCMFWFEDATVLNFAEDPSSAALHCKPLVTDAMPTTGFRKWVTTILSTTQVAQNVILLGLLFIYRLKKMNPTVRGKVGSEYRLLTVALMLGNKFLDDNTYTNKTWAEVSGISVMEVHIMEVEFLSNMKYNLFTSAEEWKSWQVLLGRFADFYQRATRPRTASATASPLANSFMPATLPSPPNSYQTSPPSATSRSYHFDSYVPPSSAVSQHSAAPREPPAALAPIVQTSSLSRKRSFDNDLVDIPSKRTKYGSPPYGHNHTTSTGNPAAAYPQSLPNISQYSISIPPIAQILPAGNPQLPLYQQFAPPQLPPLNYPTKPTSSLPPSTWAQSSAVAAPSIHNSRTLMHPHSNQASRHQSPYVSSTSVSPTNTCLLPPVTSLQSSNHASPSVFLTQRNSPYKPVRGVNTLLVPPPPRAMHQPEHIGQNQMHYQPLGRPIEERQQGRLPYVAQNQWCDGSHQKISTPVDQWPAFFSNHPQQQQPYQHYAEQLQAPPSYRHG